MSMAVSGHEAAPANLHRRPAVAEGADVCWSRIDEPMRDWMRPWMRACSEHLSAPRREPARVAPRAAPLYPCGCHVTTRGSILFHKRLHVACFAISGT